MLNHLGIATQDFWRAVNEKEAQGWDSTLVWIPRLLREAQRADAAVTKKGLTRFARDRLEFSRGVPGVFDKLSEFVEQKARELHSSANLHVHVITCGLEDLLLESSLPKHVTEIWGCTLDFDGRGRARGPKSVISFTEKTKYLFAINKGVSKAGLRGQPSLVNSYRPMNARPIPLDRMIYVGDGPTDIPCFSVVIRGGGQTIGIRRAGAGRDPLDYRPRWGPYSLDWSSNSDLVGAIEDRLEDILVRATGR